jgi:hypothetical protein
MQQETEAAIESGARYIGAAGGVSAIVGGLTATDIAAFGGLVVAVMGVLIQWHYKRKADRRDAAADRRDAELHAARLAELREENQQWQ